MATPSEKSGEYQKRIEGMKWRDLARLWDAILRNDTPGWDPGKAFEFLVVRAFRLSGLDAAYEYDVPPAGRPLEQIDGLVFMSDCVFLIEAKDRATNDIEAIAKLQHQLQRRPSTTFGCMFVTGTFTPAALTLVDFSTPHRILLWVGDDVDKAIAKKDFGATLTEKYRDLCKFGMTDHSPHYRGIEL